MSQNMENEGAAVALATSLCASKVLFVTPNPALRWNQERHAMCKSVAIVFLSIVFAVSHSAAQLAEEHYLTPDGKAAIEIAQNGGGSEVYFQQVGLNERQLIGKFTDPVHGPPLFFDAGLTFVQRFKKTFPALAEVPDEEIERKVYDRAVREGKTYAKKMSFEDFRKRLSGPFGILLLNTGAPSVGYRPVVFQQRGDVAFDKVYEFDPTRAVEFLKKFNKIPSGFKTGRLFMEVTGFREPDILEISCRGDGNWNQQPIAFKGAMLDFSLWKKEYSEHEEHSSWKQISPTTPGEVLAGNGTGFFVGKQGWILTCSHVVNDADQVKVLISTGQILECTIAENDQERGLALLHVTSEAPAVVTIALDRPATVGEIVYTAGFPVPEIQGISPKVTSGVINSLSGAQDDPNYLQISVPVQPGNSGGAVISEQGCLLGIVTARMREESFFEESGVLPQDVNYAEKASRAWALLDRQNISPETNVFQTKQGAIQNLTKATVLILVYHRSDQPERAESEPAPTSNLNPPPPPTPTYTLPPKARLVPTPKATLSPAPDYSNTKWPDERLLIHPEHFAKARVTNVPPDDELNLRRGPGTGFDVIGQIPSNATDVIVFHHDGTFDGDTWWYPVEWHGLRGYVGRHYLSADH